MLKITINEDAATQKWVLQGWLVGPWVTELRANWEKTGEQRRTRRCLVDLSDVICVDPSGELLLLSMLSDGAKIIGKGIYTKRLIADLGRKCRHAG